MPLASSSLVKECSTKGKPHQPVQAESAAGAAADLQSSAVLG